jgi:lysophospholipase L1-like esterase
VCSDRFQQSTRQAPQGRIGGLSEITIITICMKVKSGLNPLKTAFFLVLIPFSVGHSFGQETSNPRWEFLRTNLDVFPGTEKLFEPDTSLFWRLRPNLKSVRAAERLPDKEFQFSVSTDAKGRRCIPQPAIVRHTVLFLGDSCTFGIPVNDNEAFPALVQQKMEGIQSINAGVPGYSAFQGRLFLEGLNSSFRPDIVVVTFWPNDRSVWDHLGDAEHQELIEAEQSGEFSRYRIVRLLRRATPGKRPRLTGEEFADQIRQILRWCRERNSRPILQIWPARQQMATTDEIDQQQILRKIAREDRVPVVDLVPVFRQHRDSILFVDSVHATKEGYTLVAEALVPVIRQQLASKPDPVGHR